MEERHNGDHREAVSGGDDRDYKVDNYASIPTNKLSIEIKDLFYKHEVVKEFDQGEP